jgi:hypothetical protein
MDAITRLTAIYSKTDKLKPDPFLLKVKDEIDANKALAMKSEEEFIAFMDRMVIEFTDEMRRRYPVE